MPTGIYQSPNRKGGQKGRSGAYPKSEEHRKKISETLKQKYHNGFLKSSFCTMHYWRGRKRSHTEETKKKISQNSARYWLGRTDKPGMKKETHWHWIKDRTKVKGYSSERDNPEYKQWRMSVWIRDGFKCRIANQDCNGPIEAHHILGWTKFVELRYEINNGITLCHFHHPRKRMEEKRLAPVFKELVAVK